MSRPKEIVVISGKGGTGKTSLTASFAALAKEAVLADCDVDAADLHLLLNPEVVEQGPFVSGVLATIDQEECVQCGNCLYHCRFKAVKRTIENGELRFDIDPFRCEGCGVCGHFCPSLAITLEERTCGEWFVSETRYGPMVHARLGIASENSGKLATFVRDAARKRAEERGTPLVIVDGPPGVGCPVIASVTGASLLIIVTEPTVSGEHDLDRVLDLAAHFRIPAAVIVNKWDINPEMTERIAQRARERGATALRRLPYDRAMVASQLAATPVVAWNEGPLSEAVRGVWSEITALIEGLSTATPPRRAVAPSNN